ncbi:DUF4383 domain-containing protein [Brachybacterium sp. UNK5269]|uniref:DUF4383 domain-containing protein n=1 Tax=Brachybacterium sp. UNK5269 TaxID=3408576 RepID=UPI003BAEC075
MNMQDPHTSSQHVKDSPVRLAALVYGIAFLLVGLAGFIPGVTTGFESLHVGGHQSEALLLGLFQVSVLHNSVHLLFGVVGLALAMASWPTPARMFLLIGGILYLMLWVYGLVIDKDSPANFVPLNAADDWLHFVLGLTMVGLSFLPSYKKSVVRTPARRS